MAVKRRGQGLFGDGEQQPKQEENERTTTSAGGASAERAVSLPLAPAPAAAGSSRCTEPPTPETGPEPAETVRVTIYATLDQVQQLDEDRWRVRRASRDVMDRTSLIRGLLEGYRRAGVDLVAVGVRSEEDMARLVAARLRGEVG